MVFNATGTKSPIKSRIFFREHNSVGAVYILMVLNITNILSNGVISNKNILHQMATKQIASNGVFQQFKFFLLFSNNSERDTYGIS